MQKYILEMQQPVYSNSWLVWILLADLDSGNREIFPGLQLHNKEWIEMAMEALCLEL